MSVRIRFCFYFSQAPQGASVSWLFSIPSSLMVFGPIAAVWITNKSLCHHAIKNLFLASIFPGFTILPSLIAT